MPNSILSSLFSQAALTITNMGSGKVAAVNLKTIKVNIKLSAIAMRHIREDGSTIVDTKVIRPTIITIDAYCPDIDTLGQVNSILLDRSALYLISSKGIVLNNMMAQTEQIRQSPEVLSASPIRIMFKGAALQGQAPKIVAQPADASVLDKGMAILNSAKQTVAGIATKISTAIGK